jgi:hypothetical protein
MLQKVLIGEAFLSAGRGLFVVSLCAVLSSPEDLPLPKAQSPTVVFLLQA